MLPTADYESAALPLSYAGPDDLILQLPPAFARSEKGRDVLICPRHRGFTAPGSFVLRLSLPGPFFAGCRPFLFSSEPKWGLLFLTLSSRQMVNFVHCLSFGQTQLSP
jgi:hypothetical protein